MNEYIRTIINVVVAVGITTSLFSQNSLSKYINLISGIVVMAVLIMPFSDISTELERISVEELDIPQNTYLKDELEKNLEEKIHEKLKQETSQEVEVKVIVNMENEVKIEKISIKPYKEEYLNIINQYLNTAENEVQTK